MKRMRVIMLVLFMTGICYGGAGRACGEPPSEIRLTLEPVELPKEAGKVLMRYGFRLPEELCQRCDCCDAVKVEVITRGGLEYAGEREWYAHPSGDTLHEYIRELEVVPPPGDTSFLRLVLKIGDNGFGVQGYFVTTGDTMEFWRGSIHPRYVPPKPDTTKYEVRVDLRNKMTPSFKLQFEDEFGPVEKTKDTGFYIIRVPRYAVDKLRSAGFSCEYLKEPPPRKPGRPGAKGTFKRLGPPPYKPQHRKSQKDEGGEVWLDCVEGTDENGRLYPNTLIRFILGFANHYNDDVHGIVNGFRIYSPDGVRG